MHHCIVIVVAGVLYGGWLLMHLPQPFWYGRTSVMPADALLFLFKFLIWKPSGNVIHINHMK